MRYSIDRCIVLPHTALMEVNELYNRFMFCLPARKKESAYQGALVFITYVDDEVVRGLVINRPSQKYISTLMKQVAIPVTPFFSDQSILYGGPVNTDKLFMLQRDIVTGALETCLSSTVDDLRQLAIKSLETEYLAAIGECVWTVDQIADEIEHSNWLVMSGDLNLLFKVKPSDRVEAFLDCLGISVEQISTTKGQA